jgi:hypothetical protein
MQPWFLDLNDQLVERHTLPVAKIYVIDPEKSLELEWIEQFTSPCSWEQVIRTNADLLEIIADHAGCFDSRGDARRAGLFGPPFWGFEMYGTTIRHFWVWCPTPGENPAISPKKLWTSRWWIFLDEMRKHGVDIRGMDSPKLEKPTSPTHSTASCPTSSCKK